MKLLFFSTTIRVTKSECRNCIFICYMFVLKIRWSQSMYNYYQFKTWQHACEVCWRWHPLRIQMSEWCHSSMSIRAIRPVHKIRKTRICPDSTVCGGEYALAARFRVFLLADSDGRPICSCRCIRPNWSENNDFYNFLIVLGSWVRYTRFFLF